MEQDNLVPLDEQTRRTDKLEECKIENVARDEIENDMQMEKCQKAAGTSEDQEENNVESTVSPILADKEIEQETHQVGVDATKGEDEIGIKLEICKIEMKAQAAEVQEDKKVEQSVVGYETEVEKIVEDGRSRPQLNPFCMPDIIEQMIKCCDGVVLINLKNTSSLFRKFVGDLEKQKYFWRTKCYEKIPKNHIIELGLKNGFPELSEDEEYPVEYPEWFWRKAFVTWHKWKSISKCNYKLRECREKFQQIKCMKTCGDTICVSTYNGFWVMDPKIGYHRTLVKRDCSNFFFLIDFASDAPGEKLPFSGLRIEMRNKHFIWMLSKNSILFEEPNRSDLNYYTIAPQGMYDFVTYIGPTRNFCGTLSHNSVEVEEAEYTCEWTSIKRTYSKMEECLYLVLQDSGFEIRLPFHPAPTIKHYGFHTDRPTSVYVIANIVILGMEHGYILIYNFENQKQYNDILSVPPTKKIDLPRKAGGPVLFIDVLSNGLDQNPTIVAATKSKIYTIEFYLPTEQQHSS